MFATMSVAGLPINTNTEKGECNVRKAKTAVQFHYSREHYSKAEYDLYYTTSTEWPIVNMHLQGSMSVLEDN